MSKSKATVREWLKENREKKLTHKEKIERELKRMGINGQVGYIIYDDPLNPLNDPMGKR